MNDLTEEIKAKLTPEQLKVVEKWDLERQEREKILAKMEDGSLSMREAMEKIIDITPEYCEHDRSVMGTCYSCTEIERILCPEHYEDEE